MFGKQGITPTLAEFIDSHNAGWWKDNHRNLIDAHGAPYYIFTNAAPSLLPEVRVGATWHHRMSRHLTPYETSIFTLR